MQMFPLYKKKNLVPEDVDIFSHGKMYLKCSLGTVFFEVLLIKQNLKV